MTQFTENGQRFTLTSPTLLPNSASYLWKRTKNDAFT